MVGQKLRIRSTEIYRDSSGGFGLPPGCELVCCSESCHSIDYYSRESPRVINNSNKYQYIASLVLSCRFVVLSRCVLDMQPGCPDSMVIPKKQGERVFPILRIPSYYLCRQCLSLNSLQYQQYGFWQNSSCVWSKKFIGLKHDVTCSYYCGELVEVNMEEQVAQNACIVYRCWG